MSARADKRIVIIVHEPGNRRVLGQAVAEIGRTPVAIDSEDALRACLTDDNPPRAALVDTSGFGHAVWALCGLLHEHEIPFLVLSTAKDHEASHRSLEYGAASVLSKPVTKDALLKLLQSLDRRDEAGP